MESPDPNCSFPVAYWGDFAFVGEDTPDECVLLRFVQKDGDEGRSIDSRSLRKSIFIVEVVVGQKWPYYRQGIELPHDLVHRRNLSIDFRLSRLIRALFPLARHFIDQVRD